MKIFLSVAPLFACAFPLYPQITVKLNRLPDSVDEVRIRNSSTLSLVAFVVTTQQVRLTPYASSAPFVVYSDPLIDPAKTPLAAGAERVVMTAGFRDHTGTSHRLFAEPVMAAGILADGTTIGDAALLTRLMSRRSNMLLAVETALETLTDAGRHNVPRDRLIDQFKRMADSLNRWYLSAEQQVGHNLYQSIMGKLMDLPEEQAGAPFPPVDFVTQETAALNRERVDLLRSHPSLADAAFVAR